MLLAAQKQPRHGSGLLRIALAYIVAMLLSMSLMRTIAPFWEPPDKWTYDWRTTLLSPRADNPRDDIALVLIDEKSIVHYPTRSPIDRTLLAGLVEAIASAGPKAIGLDVIFERATDPAADARLITTIKDAAAPIVLGSVDNRSPNLLPENLAFQQTYIDKLGHPAGHLYFSRADKALSIGDDVVRFRFTPSRTDNKPRPSFTALLNGAEPALPPYATNHVAWLLPPKQAGADLFPTLRIAAHQPGQPITSALPPGWQAIVKNRTVLIGGEFADRDRHLTPLSVADQRRYPGVWIHAQILAQLHDGRYLYGLPAYIELVLVLLIATAAFALSLKLRGWRWENLAAFSGFAMLFALGPILFAFGNIVVPSAGLFLAWAIGGACGRFAATRS